MNKWTQSSQISLRRWRKRDMYRKGKETKKTPSLWNGVLWSLEYELLGENVWLTLLFADARLEYQTERTLTMISQETWSHWHFILLHRGLFEDYWLASIQDKGRRDSNRTVDWDVCCSCISYWKIKKILGIVPWLALILVPLNMGQLLKNSQ